MTKQDDAVDRLYQIPLEEFTAARNALAKEMGGGGSEIKRLEKPNAAAWAVNQLFWNERKTYDDVIKAAERLRTAHRQMLAGKSSDLREVETTHRDAVRKATQAARQLLEAGGAKASAAVMTAVSETLDALPSDDPPGRLTRPLKRMGFEALEGFTISAKARAEKSTPPAAKKTVAPAPTTKADQRAAESAAKEVQRNKERLRFAEAAEREAETSLDRARRAVDRADRMRQRLEEELREASNEVGRLQKEADRMQDTYDKAIAQREALQKKIT